MSLLKKTSAVNCSLLLILALAHLASAAPAQQTLADELDRLFTQPIWHNAHWGVKIVDLDTSEVLYEREAEKSFMPASNLKLYTTATGLKVLGPDYRYRTEIWAAGKQNDNGVLDGNLVVLGSGDSAISGRFGGPGTKEILKQWAEAVRAAGIRQINGAVIGDDDLFDDSPWADSWQIGYTQEWYAAESSALAVNENCWDVTIHPGESVGAPARLDIALPTGYVTFRNEIVTTAPMGKTADELGSDDEPFISFSRPLHENVVTFRGTIPKDLKPYPTSGTIHNGTLYSATLLAEELERQGVRVTGGPKDIDDLKDKTSLRSAQPRRLVHTHSSPPLSAIVSMINKPSHNFYADQLLKTIGSHCYGKGSFARGKRAVCDLLTSAGADSRCLYMEDGSGLSRGDLVEPQMTVALLAYMRKQPEFKAFYDSLPIAGVDGTIRSRMKNTPAQGNVHAKTGFIGRVRCLSGYVTSSDNHHIAFSMMANNYIVPTKLANDAQDTACVALARYAGIANSE